MYSKYEESYDMLHSCVLLQMEYSWMLLQGVIWLSNFIDFVNNGLN